MGAKTGKLTGILLTLFGILLILAGISALAGFLGLPLSGRGDVLSRPLGAMAAIYLGLGCGCLALIHGLGELNARPSRSFRLPPMFIFWIGFGGVLGLGSLVLNAHLAVSYVFPFLFLLGAALPVLAVLAHAAHRSDGVTTWREVSLMLLAGSTISFLVTALLDGILPSLAYVLLFPMHRLAENFSSLAFGEPGFIGRIFFSPLIVVFLLFTAIQAPIPEEFAKVIGPGLIRKRIQTEHQAFLLGAAAGAGFAILENMLYEGLYAQWNGWSWGGITLLRGIGSILHPLCSGIIALALFRARQSQGGWLATVGPAYALAVGLHTLWNGGFQPLVYLTGLDAYMGKGSSFSLYGTSVQVLLVVFLVALSSALWLRFQRLLRELGQGAELELAPPRFTSRALAGIALIAVAFFVPIGAMLGPSWRSIQSAALGGMPTPVPTPTPDPRQAEMVQVPDGQFLMGSMYGDTNERPVHQVTMDAFYIDVYEVSNQHYAGCVQAGVCQPPADRRYYDDRQYSDHPVVFVDWAAADAFCQWRGARLPSEAEWEKAARGTDGRSYPWGKDINCTRANYGGKPGGCIGGTTPVGSYPAGASPYGALDMAGNVLEWTADWYSVSYYADSPDSNPPGPDSGGMRTLRGGSWINSAPSMRAANRYWYIPGYLNDQIGFRCARSQ